MGRKHRLIGFALLLLAAGALASCSDDKAEQVEKRKALLVPQDLVAKRKAADDANRTLDEQGNLLPSTTKVAGLLLPRGFSVVSADEYDWYVEGPAPLAKVERYLRAHLQIGSEYRRATHNLEFMAAQPTDTPTAKPLFVSFYPKSGRFDMSRIYIHAPRPAPISYPSPQEVQAQMKARAAHAD